MSSYINQKSLFCAKMRMTAWNRSEIRSNLYFGDEPGCMTPAFRVGKQAEAAVLSALIGRLGRRVCRKDALPDGTAAGKPQNKVIFHVEHTSVTAYANYCKRF
jgi:hypothetical protein